MESNFDKDYDDLLKKYTKLQENYNSVLSRLSDIEKSDNARYTIIYKYIPVSIWEEDFSDVYRYVQSLPVTDENIGQYLTNNPDIISTAIKKVKVLDLNDFSAKLYKMKNKEDLVKNFEKLFSPSTLDIFKKELIAMKKGEVHIETEADITDIEGTKHDILLQWIVLPGYENYDRIMVTTIDITELKQGERERIQLIEQLQQKLKLESLGLFAGGIAHDFTNVLQGLNGNIQLALEKLPPGHPASQYLEKNLSLIAKGTQITRQILSFAGEKSEEKEIIDINQELLKLQRVFDVFLGNSTTLRIRTTKEPLPIEMNLGQFNQIMLNLVSNASEAVKNKQGEIIISTSLKEETEVKKWVVLSVKDNGYGIQPETALRIFDPFFTTKPEGRGLGLSVVHGIIQSCNGSIEIKSEPNTFTEFEIKLPLVDIIEPNQD